MAYVYILYSEKLNKHYIGSTELDPIDRLDQHLTKHFGNAKFTVQASDWEIIYTINCQSIRQARAIESHVKKMKSRTYIQNLIKYPEMTQKLLSRY